MRSSARRKLLLDDFGVSLTSSYAKMCPSVYFVRMHGTL